MKRIKLSVAVLLCILFLFSGCTEPKSIADNGQRENKTVTQPVQEVTSEPETQKESKETTNKSQKNFTPSDIPSYSGNAYSVINSNQPYFTKEDYKTESFELYSELDSLNRCGVAYANIGKDIMPTEERGSIGSVKPSGWKTVKYDIVDGKYLYNRCHLIGFQLSGENANEKNLITGTRYMNVQGMLPFENMVADYVKETNNHVLLRVTPVFEGDNLVATGVLMEAFSVEDEGDGICFNVFCYNVQPGITIDYSDGTSKLGEVSRTNEPAPAITPVEETKPAEEVGITKSYIGNKNTKKFHTSDCRSVKQMNDSNKVTMECIREEAINKGYSPCGICNP